MMINDELNHLERRLSRQPLRRIPVEWRAGILTSARAARPDLPRSPAARHDWLSTLRHQLSTLLWPHPKAWAGLAALWVLILGVNFSVREPAPRVTEKYAPPPPEVMVELKQQRRLFAELFGTLQTPDADRPKTFSPKPRGERVEILMT